MNIASLVELMGEINISNVDLLGDYVSKYISDNNKIRFLVYDCTWLEYIDSRAIGRLVIGQNQRLNKKRIQTNGSGETKGKIIIVNLDKNNEKIIKLADLHRKITMYEGLEQITEF